MKAIRSDINPKDCKIVVVILHDPVIKKKIKAFIDQGGIPSQFILSRTLKNAKMGVFSNLLKQMNSKLRQDIYRLNHPALKNTMLVGIDVIMNGRNKLVGCCATITKSLTQCLTKLYKQQPPVFTEDERKELQGTRLRDVQEDRITAARTEIIKEFINDAMKTYHQTNSALPEQIIIYRDGMGGPSMTTRVKEREVAEIQNLLENTTQGYKPKIIYCLVDRNI